MSESPVVAGVPGPSARLEQAVRALVAAADVAALRQGLADNPGLLQPAFDAFLTGRMQEAWKENDIRGTRDLLAGRAFLRRCRSHGVDAVLADPPSLPMGSNSPMGRLLQLSYERTDLPQRAKWARKALEDVARASEPDLWAELQRELADCLAQSQGPERAEQIEDALQAYRAVLEVWGDPPYRGSPEWAQTLHTMAATYRRRVKGERADNLQRALQLYEQALSVRTRKDYPVEWAETQQDLGSTWMEMPPGDKAENVEKGIQFYQAALSVRTRAKMPELWARSTQDLAIAYTELPGKDRAHNVERAIELSTEVLKHGSEQKNPLDWGRSHLALGSAYLMRSEGDRLDNLERAIDHLKKALDALSREACPADWARVNSNLGIAFSFRLMGVREENLEQAVCHLQQALEVYTRQAYPQDWALVQTALGNIYCLPEVEPRDERLEQAIACYEQALSVRTPENDPDGWATVKNNLGNAYADRMFGERADNQEQAIAHYQDALRLRKRETAPERWAETMNNLGAIYTERVRGHAALNQEKAVGYFRGALEVRPTHLFPHDARRSARNLAYLLFVRRRWQEAAEFFEVAIQATDQLYQAGATPTSRQVELQEARDLWAHAAYCLARLGRFATAVEKLEKGRARALSEALARTEAALEEASQEDREAFGAARERVVVLEAEARALGQRGTRDFLTVSEELGQAREALAQVIARIRGYVPGFMPIGLSYADINSAARALGRPLVYVLTTSRGSLALIVPAGEDSQGRRGQRVWMDPFKSADLDQVLRGDDDRPGYLAGAVEGQTETLKQALDRSWPVLDRGLAAPIAAGLNKLGLNSAAVIPAGTLALLPLPADSFESLVFTPSARALQTAVNSAQERGRGSPVLLGVGNPLPSPKPLPFARVEVEEIESHFEPGARRLFYEEQATRAAIHDALPGATHVHFACHGKFDPDSPLDSALSLAGKDALTLRDLLDGDLDLSAVRLVVLSACQTGITDFRQVPDEAVGLPAGFLTAGVPAVVASLWPVSDISTALLMRRFYHHHLQEGLEPGAALRQAQIWLRRATAREMALADRYERQYRASGRRDRQAFRDMRTYRANPDLRPFAHPFYWAGFIFSGVGV